MGSRERKFEELNSAVVLTVKTKCPEKWVLFDVETQRVFVGNKNGIWIELGVKSE